MRGPAPLLVALLLLALLAPAVGAQQLYENMYALDVQQGRYYAVNTGGQSYRVFYIGGGSVVYVNAYRWDANSNYIIFQAPITGRVYLRLEGYTLSTLTTHTWFNPNPAVSVQVQVRARATAGGQTAHSWVSNTQTTSTPQQLLGFVSIGWNGTSGVLTRVDSAVYQTTHIITSTNTTFPQFNGAGLLNSMTLTVELLSITPSPSSWSGTVLSAYHQIRDSSNNVVQDNAYLYYNTAGNNYYFVGVSSVSNAGFTSSPASFTLSASSSGLHGTSASGLRNYLYVQIRVTATVAVPTNFQAAQQAGGSWLLTASNGNQIHIFTSLGQLMAVSLLSVSSSTTYYIYTQQVQVSFGSQVTVDRPLVLRLNTSGFPIPRPNPAVYIPALGAWAPAYLINYGTQDTFLVIPMPTITASTLTLKVAWTYPIQYEKPTLEYLYATGVNLISIFPINGSYQLVNNVATINGSIYLANYIGSTIILDLSGTYTRSNTIEGAVGTLKALYPQNAYASVSGTFSFSRVLVLYNTLTMSGYTYTVGSPAFEPFQITQLSYMPSGQIQGSWSYRIPIYVTLAELPPSLTESGFVFRFALPLKSWVSAQLLSPALEDLLIVDANMRPLPFYVYDVDVGIVYVKYTNAIYSSNIVIYVLLRNTQLWGTGNSFSSLTATFDKINPFDFADDFGYSVFYTYMAYNLLVVRPQANVLVKFGKTWYDFVAVNNTLLWEQHGSTRFYNTSLSLGIGDKTKEILVIVDRQRMRDVLVYVDGQPKVSFDLSEFQSDPCLYVGYRDARAVYVGRTLFYSYSIGDVQGGLQRPTLIAKPQQQTTPMVDWGTLFLMIFAMIGLGIAARLLQGGVGRGGGGGPLSRF